MATPAYKIVDRRGKSGGWASNNGLYKASRGLMSQTRTRINDLNFDSPRNISAYGRKSMVTIGRWIFANVPAIRGAVLECANYASSSWIPQFYGDDKEWGSQAENWLYEHDKICDLRGWPYTMATYRRNLVLAVLRDCDLFTLFTETDGGYPLIQVLGCQRIGCEDIDRVTGGEFDGANICDGVITDDFGRVIGYRIIDPVDAKIYRDLPAKDGMLSYLPENPDQVRGVSALASALFDWQDISESRTLELLAQKVSAAIALIEENETGEADTAKAIVAADQSFTGNAKSTIASETIEGGMVRYFRAGQGNKITAHSYDRPGANSQQFEDRIIRAAFAGMGWSYDFSLDPTKAGGAQMRVVVEKVNRAVELIQQHVLLPAIRRIDGWRISKAIKLGLLPPSNEWYKWEYQGPARLTADEKYQSDVDTQELNSGTTTLQRITAKRGQYWEDVRKQQDLEVDDLLARARAMATKYGITMEQALTLYRTTGSYSTFTNAAPPMEEGSKSGAGLSNDES